MISFELSDEQKEIRDWVHSFAEKEIRPVAHEYDADAATFQVADELDQGVDLVAG